MPLTRENYYTSSEMALYLRTIRQRPHKHMERDNALFSFLMGTGVRATECLRTTIGDLSLGAGTQEDPCSVKVMRLKKKAPTPAEVFFSTGVRNALQAYLRKLPTECRNDDAVLFPVTRQGLWSLARYYMRRAGLSKRSAVHACRHTRAIELYSKTRDLAFVASQLGHSKIETTMIYVHIVDGMSKAAQVELPGLEDDPVG